MALVDTHKAALARLRLRTATFVGATWAGLGSYDEADVAPFVERVTPVVTAAQRTAAALTIAYLARRLGGLPPPLDLDAFTGAGVRNGAEPAVVYRRPFVNVWSALAAGTAWRDAVASGGARARQASETDIALAMRSTMQGVQDSSEGRIIGYERVTSGACAYCEAIDGAFVKRADAMPLHPGCGCDLEPVTADERGARGQAAKLDRLEATPLPDTVAVHEHGELGPTLTDAEYAFTSESDLS